MAVVAIVKLLAQPTACNLHNGVKFFSPHPFYAYNNVLIGKTANHMCICFVILNNLNFD